MLNINIKKGVIPIDFKDGYYAEIFSDGNIVLTGNFDIEELEETVLKLKNNEHRICLYGKNISIISYTSDGVRLSGIFDKIEF